MLYANCYVLLVVLFRMKGLRKATLWLYTSRGVGGWVLGERVSA